MNKHILLASSILVATTLSVSLLVSAQGVDSPVPTLYEAAPSSSASTVGVETAVSQEALDAKINIYFRKIKKISLVNYDFTFSFRSSALINQEAYYRILLKDENQKTVFSQGFPNKVDIGAGESKPITGTFIVPQDFKGLYSVFIQITNAKGLALATDNAGQIELSGGKTVMSIKSCEIEGGNTKSTIENINTSCLTSGSVTKNTTMFTTVYYGGMASPSAQVKSKIVSGKATFIIPARSEGGEYQVISQLYDAGRPMSSPIFSSFTVEGQSAKIINVTTDRGSYLKEEMAKISVIIRTVNIPTGELFARAQIKNKDGSICGELSPTIVKSIDSFTLLVPITQKCSLPSVIVSVQDKAGKVLDTLTTSIVVEASGEKEQPVKSSNINLMYVGVGIATLLILGFGFIFLRRFRSSN